MAEQYFKEIVDRRGYKVDSEDRAVFEKEISKSNFGLGCSDMIEFILYDASENQLPQGDDGKMVRYININDSNINDYFIISNNLQTKKKNDSAEFIVDLERLITEAGYSNGIFKTQVTLLNRRAGTEGGEDDSLWIHEISPSRTEIRVLPTRARGNNIDLEQRYSTFTDEKNFRDDIIYYVNIFIDNLNLERILSNFLLSKGRETDGKKYVDLIKLEFNVPSFEILLNRVKRKFIQSMQHYIGNRNWRVNDINYGKPTGESINCVELTINDITSIAQTSLINCIDFNLPKRNIQVESILSKDEQITLDKVKDILKTSTSNSSYNSTIPDKVNAVVRGCNDSQAENYNPLAQENDGSCRYKEVEVEVVIKGCTKSTALNYNPKATEDDGSCKYQGKIDCVTKNYYVWSATASLKWKDNGVQQQPQSGVEYDSFSIKHDVGQFRFSGDVREVPKTPVKAVQTYKYTIQNNNHHPYYQNQAPRYNDIANYYGQSQFGNNSYQEYGQVSNPYFSQTAPAVTVTYKDPLGNTKHSSMLNPGDSTTVCAQEGTVVSTPGVVVNRAGVCTDAVLVEPTPPRPTQTSSSSGGSGGGGGGSQGQDQFIQDQVDEVNGQGSYGSNSGDTVQGNRGRGDFNYR